MNMHPPQNTISRRVGFVSTRFEGTDGVTQETEKWVKVFERMGCQCFYFAGMIDWDPDRSYQVDEANFKNPAIYKISQEAFNSTVRHPQLTRQITRIKDNLKSHLYSFIQHFGIELLVVENALAIPMNIPLGLALAEFIAETGLPVIAHHHDLFWERKRFLVNCIWDYLNMAFPPHLPSIRHVVINSSAANQLSLRTGISSMIIPNVMDFEHPPVIDDSYSADVRRELHILRDECFFLQPTRVVPRKGIEHAIELTRRLGLKAKLVVSHASGDEGYEYEKYLRDYAALLGVTVYFEADIINSKRGIKKDGKKIYTLYDVYPHADLVTYPSDLEGFGNAFLEAVYFRRPIVVKKYTIFDIDIKPKGFKVIEFDGFITDGTVSEVRDVLTDKTLALEMADHNYAVAKKHYSFNTLENRLRTLLSDCFGED